jgi:hypothetical protein
MNLLLLLAAGDLIVTVMRARQEARAEAIHGARQAERYLAWAREYDSPEQVAAAQQTADAWRDYRDSLQ